jgi:class 3 adenylate cyclase
MLGVGLVSLFAATLVGITAGASLGKTIVDDGLTALRSSASTQVAGQLNYYERVAQQLAASPQSARAITAFAAALEPLSSLPESELRPLRSELIESYENQYLAPLRVAGDAVQIGDILSSSSAAIYLQAAYSVPDDPITDASSVPDAGDGSEWTSVHARVHPALRTAVVQGGLLDVYLIDAGERVVYSVAKGPDLGSSLAVGPFSGSVVARAADAAVASDDGIVTDLSFYRGVPGRPIGAAAAAVRDDTGLVGVVVLTYDGAVYTDGLTSLRSSATRESPGLDLYVIGTGGTTRSDPQSFLADPPAFLEASEAAGVLNETQRAVIERTGTTVLVQPATESTVNTAVDGDTQPGTSSGLTGAEVISATEQVPVSDVDWYTVAEVDAAAADANVVSFRQILLVGAAVFVLALAFVAVGWSQQFMRPVRLISERLGRRALAQPTSEPVAPLRISAGSPAEFHDLADSLAAMGAALRQQQDDLADARAERLAVLERMVPPSVARRVATGDIDSLEQVPATTVVVVVVLGLGALIDSSLADGDRRVLDELHAELDTIAFEQGLDRIKVVGDSYLAVCGHDRPYIDHASRALGFAEGVAEAVRTLSRATQVGLDTAIGISSGPVTVGMSGGNRLVYDVWGPTVTTAHTLARSAGAGEIVLTEATRSRLPDDIELQPKDVNGSDPNGSHGRPGPALWTVVIAHANDRPADVEATL